MQPEAAVAALRLQLKYDDGNFLSVYSKRGDYSGGSAILKEIVEPLSISLSYLVAGSF